MKCADGREIWSDSAHIARPLVDLRVSFKPQKLISKRRPATDRRNRLWRRHRPRARIHPSLAPPLPPTPRPSSLAIPAGSGGSWGTACTFAARPFLARSPVSTAATAGGSTVSPFRCVRTLSGLSREPFAISSLWFFRSRLALSRTRIRRHFANILRKRLYRDSILYRFSWWCVATGGVLESVDFNIDLVQNQWILEFMIHPYLSNI